MKITKKIAVVSALVLLFNQAYSQSSRKKLVAPTENKEQKKETPSTTPDKPKIGQTSTENEKDEELISTTFKSTNSTIDRIFNLKKKGIVIVQLGNEKNDKYMYFKYYDSNLKLINESKKKINAEVPFYNFSIATNTDSTKIYCYKSSPVENIFNFFEYSIENFQIKYTQLITPTAYYINDLIVHKDEMYISNNLRKKGKRSIACCFMARYSIYDFNTQSDFWKINLPTNTITSIKSANVGIEYGNIFFDQQTQSMLVSAVEKVSENPAQISHGAMYELKNNKLTKLYDIKLTPKENYKLENFRISKSKTGVILGIASYSESKKPVEAKTKFDHTYFNDITTKGIDSYVLLKIEKDKYTKLIDLFQGSMYSDEEYNNGMSKSGKEINFSQYTEITKYKLLGREFRVQVYIDYVEFLPDGGMLLKTRSVGEVNKVYYSPTNEKAATMDINFSSYCKINSSGKLIWKKDIKKDDVQIAITPLQLDPSVYLYTQNAKSFNYAFMKNDEIPSEFMNIQLKGEVKPNEEIFTTTKPLFMEWYNDYAAIMVYQTNVPKKEIERFKKLKIEADKGSYKAKKELEDETVSRSFIVLTKAKINL